MTSAKEERVRRLRDEAVSAIESGKHDVALTLYTQLTKLEPDEPAWLQRIADTHRRLGQKPLELKALLKAADAYRDAGFALKATALCKMALSIDPSNLGARTQLAELCAPAPSKRRSLGPARGQSKRPAAGQSKRPAAGQSKRPAAGQSKRPGSPKTQRPRLQVPPLTAKAQSKSKAPAPAPSAPSLPLSSASLIPKLPKTRQERVSLGVYELVLGNSKPARQGAIKISFKGPPRARIAQTLARTPLFGEVDAATLPTLIERIELVALARGQILFREGDPADALYVVADGEMAAFRRGVELGTLGEGDFFGEIGLISDQPHQATLGATRDAVLLKLNRALVNQLIESRPGFLKVVLSFLRARLVRTLMLTSPLFAKLGATEQKAVSGQFKFLEIEPGTTLVEQGIKTQGLFILLEGRATVQRESDGKTKEIAQLQSGDIFGEMSLLNQAPANASVSVATRSFALFLSASRFHRLVMTNPMMLEAVSNVAHERQAVLDAIGAPDGRADLIWIKPTRNVLPHKPHR